MTIVLTRQGQGNDGTGPAQARQGQCNSGVMSEVMRGKGKRLDDGTRW
jgi:hypothetical protein